LGKKLKYKFYFRKSSFKKDNFNANIFINLLLQYKPKIFLEVGVLEGVTARNVCELLYQFHNSDFKYIGIDLFGTDIKQNNIKEYTPIAYNHSNPIKNFYYKYILKKHPNSIEGVKHILKKFNNFIELHKGYSKDILNTLNLSNVDFCFLDGGHSYETVKNDLSIILKKIKKNSIILVDDYFQTNYGVKKAVDEIKHRYFHKELGRFLLIINN